MEFRVLGPLAVVRDEEIINIGGPRQRIVLAILLLSAPQVVSVGALVDAVWPDDPPVTAREQVQICISNLRQRLDMQKGPAQIVTRAPGYALVLGEAGLDLNRFDAAVQAGRIEAAAGRVEEAAAAMGEALGWWRGPVALPGLDGLSVRDAATRLAEQRVGVLEDYVDLELRCGRHAEVVGLLGNEIDRNPLRERLRAQLMLALFRGGRKADALREFQRARRISVEELGLEPADELRSLEQAILHGGPGLEVDREPFPPAQQSTPHQLPAPIADFTGRIGSVDAVLAAVAVGPAASSGSVPIAVVCGPGGVGKTALAVHVAHRLSADHPDGQLFVTMHGDTQPVRAAAALERFLRALGVPGSLIPDDLDERAERYRDRLAGRRVLVVLDDIASVTQVLPLLPPAGGCAVLITSRRRITALPGAQRVELSTFSPASALALLERVVGEERIWAESAAAAELVRRCGHLPLAVRIAGARLAARPHWTVADMVDRIGEGQLDELDHEGMGVRACLRLAYESLEPPARTLLRRIALIDPPDFGGWACAALLDVGPRAAQDLLGELVGIHLVEVGIAADVVSTRYRLHDLVRFFARECAAVEDGPADRADALDRYLGAFLNLVDAAHRREYGGDFLIVRTDAARHAVDDRLQHRLIAEPLRWLASERHALAAAVEQAAAAGRHRICWSLAVSAVTLFEAHAHFDDWRGTHDMALAAARRGQDRLGEAVTLYSIGSLHVFEQHFPEAEQLLAAALPMFAELDCPQGVGMVLRNQAFVDRVLGDVDRARNRLGEALAIFRDTGDSIGEAHVLSGLAQLDLDLDRNEEALVLLKEAAAICARVGNRRVGAQVAHRLGDLHLAQGRLDEATVAFGQVLTFAEVSGDPVAQVFALAGTGSVEARRGETGPARALLERAERLAADLGEQRMQARTLLALSSVSLVDGRVEQAGVEAESAMQVSHRIGSPIAIAAAESQMGDVELAKGDRGRAIGRWSAALHRIEAVAGTLPGDLATQLSTRLEAARRAD
jgi:DNA-binding SARP family transcriptional activator/tetratricopeptide (TPR) repeat protein